MSFFVVVRVGVVLGIVLFWIADELLVLFKASLVGVVTDQSAFSCNDSTFFKDKLSRVSRLYLPKLLRNLQYHLERAHEL